MILWFWKWGLLVSYLSETPKTLRNFWFVEILVVSTKQIPKSHNLRRYGKLDHSPGIFERWSGWALLSSNKFFGLISRWASPSEWTASMAEIKCWTISIASRELYECCFLSWIKLCKSPYFLFFFVFLFVLFLSFWVWLRFYLVGWLVGWLVGEEEDLLDKEDW